MKSRLSSHSISSKLWLICEKHAELFLNAQIHNSSGLECLLCRDTEAPVSQLTVPSSGVRRVLNESRNSHLLFNYLNIIWIQHLYRIQEAWKSYKCLGQNASNANLIQSIFLYIHPPTTRVANSCCGCYWWGLEKSLRPPPRLWTFFIDQVIDLSHHN